MHRNSILAAKKRDRLFQTLGAVCVDCGTTTDLTFDLIKPDSVAKSHHSNMSWLQRVNYYWHHHSIGNVTVRCNPCNARKNNRPVLTFDLLKRGGIK